MAEKKNTTKKYFPERNLLKQLSQLTEITSENDLISVPERDILLERGLVTSSYGFSVITAEGIQLLAQLNVIHPKQK